MTVLFCDVVDSTGLGERLDPETVRLVMMRYFREAAARLERHGGTVEKFIGDEVMAVFGVPAVREDDALRAIRAAIELRECAAAIEIGLDAELKLQVRIGLNTGEVVTGDPFGGDSFVTGNAVNIAKRIEQAAAPGEILIGEETHRLVAHAVVALRAGEVTVRGDRVVGAFQVQSGSIPTPQPNRGGPTPPSSGGGRELVRMREIYREHRRGQRLPAHHDHRRAGNRKVAAHARANRRARAGADSARRSLSAVRRGRHLLASA